MGFLDEINSPADLRQYRIEDLQAIADETRQYIIDTCSRIGGHTGASLGAVELAVAMHYVFDTPRDRLVWDVGHQAYAHKILTGRREELKAIKQPGGISGFLRRDESEYDTFGAGHASTSISAALGMAAARDIKKEDFHVCALIGDSSLAGGMAMEAVNQAGHLKSRLIVILNDNEMSIAPAVGALSRYLNRIKEAQSYHDWKEGIGDALQSVPGIGDKLRAAAKSVKDAIAAAVLPGALVNELGFKYIGYVDGHSVPMLVRALEEAKTVTDGPVIVHAITQKGKGFPNPEKNYYAYHATGPYDPKTGLPYKSTKVAPPSYTQVFGETMCELMERDERIVGLTAAMPDGTGIDKVLEKFPERSFDVGIAEQHAVTFCAGMACEGLKPVAAIYSTFLQRGFDQVIHDVCLQDLDVTFAMDRAGIVGADGPTHHGLLDITYLRGYPNIVLMAPKDEAEMRDMMLTAIEHPGPAALRYPRGNGVGVDISDVPKKLEIGRGEVLREGADASIIAYGSMVYPSLAAADILAARGIKVQVINARFVKPLDAELILKAATDHEAIITVEEGYLAGGFGSAVVELLEENGLLDSIKVARLGVPDEIVTHGDQKVLLGQYGLDAEGIAAKVDATLAALRKPSASENRIRAVR